MNHSFEVADLQSQRRPSKGACMEGELKGDQSREKRLPLEEYMRLKVLICMGYTQHDQYDRKNAQWLLETEAVSADQA